MMTTDTIREAAIAAFTVDQETGGILIPLGGKKFSGMFSIVDEDDIPMVSDRFWHAADTNPAGARQILYAASRGRPEDGCTQVYMHRIILGIRDRSIKVDHKNHNGLDNRRSNIRVATNQQNSANRRPRPNCASRFNNVCWDKSHRKWVVMASIKGKRTFVGYFSDEIEAAKAADRVAFELYGEFAFLNFPEVAA